MWISGKNYFFIFTDFAHILYYWGAPIFLFCAGFGFFIFISKMKSKNIKTTKIFIEVFKRAAFLFVISTIIYFFFGFTLAGPYTFILYWSIFQLIAISMVSFFLLPLLKRQLRIILYFTIVIFIAVLTTIILMFEIESLYFSTDGVFPILPFGSFYLTGMYYSDLLNAITKNSFNKFVIINLIIGIILMSFAVIFYGFLPFFWMRIYLIGFGEVLIAFPVTLYIFDIKEYKSSLTDIIIKWGKLAFSLYYVHMAVLAAGAVIFPILIYDLYMSGFNVYLYLLIVVVFTFSVEILRRIWEKHNYFLSLEWIMSKFTQKSMFSKEDTQIIDEGRIDLIEKDEMLNGS